MRPAAEEEEEQPASEHALLSERTRVRINRRFVKTGKMERLEKKERKNTICSTGVVPSARHIPMLIRNYFAPEALAIVYVKVEPRLSNIWMHLRWQRAGTS